MALPAAKILHCKAIYVWYNGAMCSKQASAEGIALPHLYLQMLLDYGVRLLNFGASHGWETQG